MVCRELTKRFEAVVRGPLDSLAADFAQRRVKGEVVVLVDRAAPVPASDDAIGSALAQALTTMTVKDAATFVSQTLGVSRKAVYQIALRNTKV